MPRSKINHDQADKIRVREAQGETRKDLADEFDLSVSQITEIVNGHSWRTPGTPAPAKRTRTGRPRKGSPLPAPADYGSCACGCGEPLTSPSTRYVRRHYQSSQEHRDRVSANAKVPRTDAEFVKATLDNCEEVDLGYRTPCMLWKGAVDKKTGYVPCTRTMPDRTKVNSSRSKLVLEAHLGRPLADGECCDHLCGHTGNRDARRCMNPSHMSPATYATNMRNSPRTQLTRAIADEVVRLYNLGKTTAEIGRMFDISQSHAWNIAKGRRWAA